MDMRSGKRMDMVGSSPQLQLAAWCHSPCFKPIPILMDDQRTALVSYLADSDTAGIFTRWKGRPGNCCTKFKPISIIGPECSLMCIRVGKIEAGVRQIKIMKWNLKISIGALCQAYFSLLPIASWSSGDNILMETRIQPGKRFPPPCSERRRGGESQARRSRVSNNILQLPWITFDILGNWARYAYCAFLKSLCSSAPWWYHHLYFCVQVPIDDLLLHLQPSAYWPDTW